MLSAAIFAGLTNETDPAHRIVVIARKFGLFPASATETVRAGVTCSEAAGHLGLMPASPIMILDRVVRTREGRAIEWRLAHCNLGTGLRYVNEMR